MFHFALAHFPISLLITGTAILFLSFVIGKRHDEIQLVSLVILSVGALMTIPTVGAGLWIASEHESHHLDLLNTHRFLGIATLAVVLFGVLSHLFRKSIANADLIRNLLFFISALLVSATGYFGGEMAHGQDHQIEQETDLGLNLDESCTISDYSTCNKNKQVESSHHEPQANNHGKHAH